MLIKFWHLPAVFVLSLNCNKGYVCIAAGCHITKTSLERKASYQNWEWRQPARLDVSLPMNSHVNTHSAKSQLLCVLIVCCQSLRRSIVDSCQFVSGVQGRARASAAACRDRQGMEVPVGQLVSCNMYRCVNDPS